MPVTWHPTSSGTPGAGSTRSSRPASRPGSPPPPFGDYTLSSGAATPASNAGSGAPSISGHGPIPHRSRMGSGASTSAAGAGAPGAPTPSGPSSTAMSRSHSVASQATYGSGFSGVSVANSASPLAIMLDSDHLVLRGQGGEMEPAYLSGYVSLWLAESANIKDITMNLSGKAKVHFSDSSNHNYTHPIISHDWSFLQGDKRHTHTLKAGLHTFPFSFTIDGNLPSSITTFTGDGSIQYRLRATVVRSGFSFNLSANRSFEVLRTFTPEALEFNQTLEIENTWPGKIMYSITLPFKAYAAGDSIPVLLKFMPIAKGVRVISIRSVIKEYSVVNTRGSGHAESRTSIAVQHTIENGQAVLVDREITRPPPSWTGIREADWRPEAVEVLPNGQPTGTRAAASSSRAAPNGERLIDPENPEQGDDEVTTRILVPIPPWTTPTHTIKPVYVTHKIKWSCSIANADGHTSELRCALPICILDPSLFEEARANGAPARNLLLGIGANDDSQHVDLPSYSNHVYDRVAVAEPSSSGFSLRSATASHNSPSHTPPASRPGSPTGDRRRSAGHAEATDLPPRRQLTELEAAAFRQLGLGHSGPPTPPAAGGSGEHSQEHSHSASRFSSIMGSRAGSRAGSRGGSRAGSRASSPERHSQASSEETQTEGRRGFGNKFHIKALSSLGTAKSPILRHSSSTNSPSMSGTNLAAAGGSSSGLTRNALSFADLPAPALEGGRQATVAFEPKAVRRAEARGQGTRFHLHNDEEEEEEQPVDEERAALSRVPSYTDEAATQFVVPLDPTLPSYVDSEQMERNRSETSLPAAEEAQPAQA